MSESASTDSRALGTELFGITGFGGGDTARALELVAQGADLNLANPEGVTTLMCAAAEGMTDVVAAMLDSGRPVALNAQDSHGWTALTTAAHRGQGDIVRLLLKAGADADIPDQMKRKALDYARDGAIKTMLQRHVTVAELTRKATVTDKPVLLLRPLQLKRNP